jgi:CRP-like cAMP-binding protein
MDTSGFTKAIARLSAPMEVKPAVLSQLLKAVSTRQLNKSEHLSREGDIAHALYFINKGILRYYYLDDGVEHTGQFFEAGMLFADVLSFTTGAPGQQNIDALTESEVLVIPRAAVAAAYDADHAMERMGRRAMEEAMAGSQRRTESFLKLSPDERYSRFLRRRPVVAEQVPQYVIASYLGVTPEALSRIRRRRVQKSD